MSIPLKLGRILGFRSNSSLETAAGSGSVAVWNPQCAAVPGCGLAKEYAEPSGVPCPYGACDVSDGSRYPPKSINIDEQKPDAPNCVVLFKHILAFFGDDYICENLRKIKRCLGKDPFSKGFVLDQETTPHSACVSSCCCEVWWGNSGTSRVGLVCQCWWNVTETSLPWFGQACALRNWSSRDPWWCKLDAHTALEEVPLPLFGDWFFS